MNWLSLLEPIITVVGWFVGAAWAIRHVNLAHNKARDLQYEVMTKAHEDTLINKTIEILLIVNKSIEDFRESCVMLANAALMDMHAKRNAALANRSIEIEYQRYLPEIREAFVNLTADMEHLRVWQNVAPDGLFDSEKSDECLAILKRNFIEMPEQHKTGTAWLKLQMALVGIEINGSAKVKKFIDAWDPLNKDLQSVQSTLIALVAGAHRKLMATRAPTRRSTHGE